MIISKLTLGNFTLFLSPFFGKALNLDNGFIKSSNAEVLLGIAIDSNLSFSDHVAANCKFYVWSRDSKDISLKKRLIFIKLFNISQISYSLLIWMTHSRGLNNKIIHIHERALRNEIFNFRDDNNKHGLRIGTHLTRTILNTADYKIESIKNLGVKI